MSLRSINAGPYSTYDEFERVFDRAHKALNYDISPQEARELGYFVPMQAEFIPHKPDPNLNPHGFTLKEKYLYGIQNGLTFDPLQWGMPFGRPVQGFGHNLVGSPDYPHPNWPHLVPVPPRIRPNPEEDGLRPRYRPY